ncbi:hypothetical protein FX983_06546 [Pseudomonas frederiksbergensis]|uniref:Uncharacterized protein n=1 Tax=Pseudomonas frederiksbergensis TaxID=104087 RepID=A0A6L5BK47_9PSED|nr:hypothetical protein FX983_06546 [Pseudomonas frederiksbergensis]
MLAFLGNHIRHQTFVAGVLARQHHGFAYTFARREFGLDLAQFDAETADFHLVIVTPQVFDAAVSQPAAEVTGAVHPRAWLGAERVVEKAFGGEFVAVQVTPRHTGTADVHFTDHADRYWLTLGIQHVQLQVGNAPANRAHADQLRIRRVECAIGHVHRGFGDAVHVDQLRLRVLRSGIPRLENPGFQRFAAEDHLAQAVAQVNFALGRNQLAEGARRLVEDGHTGLAQQCVAVLRRAADQLRHHQQLAAVGQRAPDFPDREIESKGMEQRPHILRAEVEPRLGRREQPRDVAVLDHHAFGQAGGTGGVDHVGQVRRGQARNVRVVLRGRRFVAGFDQVEQQRRDVHLRQLIAQWQLSQQCYRCAVVEHVGDALGRVSRVERHVTGAGLEDAEQADNHFQTTLDADRHPIIRAHTECQQTVGHLIGAGVEFAVGQAQVFIDHRHGVGLRGGPSFELVVDQRVMFIEDVGGVPGVEQLLTLGGWQHGQRLQRGVRRGFQRGDQILQRDLHIGANTLGADRLGD